MKKIFLTAIAAILIPFISKAQWLGTNPVYFNAGNVGIGTATPTAKLHVFNSFDPNVSQALRLFYNGSWGTPTYATDFRFIDVASTEGGGYFSGKWLWNRNWV